MKFTMPATIEDLPDPIIEYILSYLSPYRDLKQCMQVNRAWYRYVCGNYILQKLWMLLVHLFLRCVFSVQNKLFPKMSNLIFFYLNNLWAIVNNFLIFLWLLNCDFLVNFIVGLFPNQAIKFSSIALEIMWLTFFLWNLTYCYYFLLNVNGDFYTFYF